VGEWAERGEQPVNEGGHERVTEWSPLGADPTSPPPKVGSFTWRGRLTR
jgi:hypothetical protein